MFDVSMTYGVAIACGYLLGSVPSGILIGNAFYGRDPRDGGSGKSGATNVLRTLGRTAAVAVVALDTMKSVVAVAIARSVAPDEPWSHVLAALAAMVGHTWPVFARFRGGRGALVGGMSLLALDLQVFLISITIFIAVAWGSRIMSIASLLSVVYVPALMAWRWYESPGFPIAYVAYGVLAGVFVVLTHRDNIGRLLNGTERRIGQPATVLPVHPGGGDA